jgi:ADP-heptose:LPS heptosyltransferase
VKRFPRYLDELIEFPGFPGIPEVRLDPRRTITFLSSMQRRPFDIAVQLQGDGSVIDEFAVLLGAKRVAGFVPTGAGLAPPRDDAADLWLPYPARGHEVDRLLALPRALGAAVDDHLEFPVSDRDRADAARLRADVGIGSAPFAILHAGGSRPDRRWPAQRFAAIADALTGEGLAIVLTGTAGEAHVTDAVRSAMRGPATDLAGHTSLGALAALVESARVVVTNDTGVSHVAAAIGADSVTIFTASDRERWAPRGTGRHVAVGSGVPDGQTGRVDVPVPDVMDAVRRLLADRAGRGTA